MATSERTPLRNSIHGRSSYCARVFRFQIQFAMAWIGFATAACAESAHLSLAEGFGASDYDAARVVTVDTDGNIYVMGEFSETVDFAPGPDTRWRASRGKWDVFLQKINSEGSLVWVRTFGGIVWDYASGIAIDDAGNVFLTGYYRGTMDADPGPGTFTLPEADLVNTFLIKLNAEGNFEWAGALGRTGSAFADDIVLNPSGNLFIAGTFYQTVDFDPSEDSAFRTSLGEYDLFVCEFDSAGNFLWVTSTGDTGFDYVRDLDVDSLGNVYIVGEFEGTVDFDPSEAVSELESGSSDSMFVWKLNPEGDFVWARSVPAYTAYGIALDGDGNAVVTGSFVGTVDFDPGPEVTELTEEGAGGNAYVLKLDSNGDFLWAGSLGGDEDDESRAIATDGDGSVYTTGKFSGTADFDPGPEVASLTSYDSNDDIYISKLSADGEYRWAHAFGGVWDDEGIDIAVDADGNPFTVGSFFYTVDFDPGAGELLLQGEGGSDAFLLGLVCCRYLDEAWVDFGFDGAGDGSESAPFNALDDAVTAVSDFGTVIVKGDSTTTSSPETVLIRRPMLLESTGGSIQIGTP